MSVICPLIRWPSVDGPIVFLILTISKSGLNFRRSSSVSFKNMKTPDDRLTNHRTNQYCTFTIHILQGWWATLTVNWYTTLLKFDARLLLLLSLLRCVSNNFKLLSISHADQCIIRSLFFPEYRIPIAKFRTWCQIPFPPFKTSSNHPSSTRPYRTNYQPFVRFLTQCVRLGYNACSTPVSQRE